ncbi:hypothetical protein [Phyllobacterium sp. OV277]|uniref:hypothetical protein n=1 Tax=Phyllobacterium sp. OV277 TaxID=1882772 RepID=UPI00088E2AA5|nr:hypothetical protein [Phyllobacterium sp. OV277]SDP08196.1 hypothetical protein SAMN05443582_103352 [Phyllobacterium sp. OV277]
MPRTGGIYTAPAGTKGVPNTTIQSAPYNALVDDLVADANAARPITAGGTGATNATDSRVNLGAFGAADLLAAPTKAIPVDNDSLVILDSEDTQKPKRVLWSVIKARLKAFFDPIYQVTLANVPNIELNSGLTANSGSFIDFHSVFPATDFDARLIRNAGANGTFDILNNGEGQMRFFANAGSYFNKAMIVNGRVTGVGEFMAQAASAAGNVHFYMMDADGFTTRAILYAQANRSAILAVNGGNVGFGFNNDGSFTAPGRLVAGSSYMQTDGNIGGTAYTGGSVMTHIDSRASAYAGNAQSAAINASIIDSRMAGNIEVAIATNQTQTTELHTSGYVLTRMSKNGQGQFGILFGSRQPQLYCTNKGGWYAAFNY